MNTKTILIIGVLFMLILSFGIFSPSIIASGEGQEDTSKIAFVSNRDGNEEIYLMNSDGSDQHRLTNTPKDEESPIWSPNSSRIAEMSLD